MFIFLMLMRVTPRVKKTGKSFEGGWAVPGLSKPRPSAATGSVAMTPQDCSAFSLGVFDFMQRHENRSAADLKQCMPVRKFVRHEPAPTPRHCHVWHQSTTESVSKAAGSLSWRSFSRATAER